MHLGSAISPPPRSPLSPFRNKVAAKPSIQADYQPLYSRKLQRDDDVNGGGKEAALRKYTQRRNRNDNGGAGNDCVGVPLRISLNDNNRDALNLEDNAVKPVSRRREQTKHFAHIPLTPPNVTQ